MSEENLEPLITQCPNCETRFRVTEAQLQVAQGRVRCGACLTVFDGTSRLSLDGETLASQEDPADVDALLEELNELGGGASATQPAAPRRSESRETLPDALLALEAELLDDLHSVDRAEEDDAAASQQLQTAQQVAPELLEEMPAGPSEDGDEQSPRETESSETPSPVAYADVFPELEDVDEAPPRSWLTLALILLAIVALPAQVLWFQYETWVKDPAYRPMYAIICEVVGCELPALRDASKIASKKSVIRAHPERPDARIVDVLMVNNAKFAQPFPLIELIATSLRGQLVAGRRFKPAEYLQGEVAQMRMFPPNTPVHVSLEIQDPGDQALNFEVRFR